MTVSLDTYDIVVVGGGAAGCVIAGKLAAEDPSLRILILEAGPHSLNHPTHIQPARYFANVTRPDMERKSLTMHVAQPAEGLLGRRLVAPAGHVMGGGSAVNFMVYTRASASDYDAWETEFGNKGWGSKDLIPLLKEVETYTPYDPSSFDSKESEVHGDKGPLAISFNNTGTNIGEQFLQVVGAYDKVRKVGVEFNDFESGDKYARWAKYINPDTGRRSDTAHAFVYSQAQNKNLVVEAECRVVRILFEGTKAVGVEYIDSKARKEARKAGTANGVFPTKKAYATGLVVISAGSFGTPAILERSGIGRADILRAHGVQQIVDLPGVGENYMDHNLGFSQYAASEEAETLDEVFYGDTTELTAHEAEWTATGKGLLSRNGLDAGGKIRPTAEELKEMGEPFRQRWKEFYENSPDKPVMLMGAFAAFAGNPRPAGLVKSFNMLYYSGYPSSLGSVHIAHGTDPFAPLNFDCGYFKNEDDVAMFRWVYKHGREISRRMPFYRGELVDHQPPFPPTSAVACKAVADPVPIDAPKLVYSKEDDAIIDEFHRKTIATAWHAAGTCAMKPREMGGVVDSRLNVYGTSNLKLADMSICPENVGANTCNTALAIGLKAAGIISEELRK